LSESQLLRRLKWEDHLSAGIQGQPGSTVRPHLKKKIWMTLEDVMSEIVEFHLCEVHRVVKLIDTESRTVVARTWGRGKEKCCLMGTGL
jgi:hypothetical protein